MKITNQKHKKKTLKFKDVKRGQVFSLGNPFYLKIDSNVSNAVNLISNIGSYWVDDEIVDDIFEAELILK